MRLWKNNRIDSEWSLTPQELTDRFLASPFADIDQYPWPLTRAVGSFIGAQESDGGLASTFDHREPAESAEYDTLLDLITEQRWAGRTTH